MVPTDVEEREPARGEPRARARGDARVVSRAARTPASTSPSTSPEFLGRFVFGGDADARVRPARRRAAEPIAMSAFDAPGRTSCATLVAPRAGRGSRPARRHHRRARAAPTRAPPPTSWRAADGVLAGTACATEVVRAARPDGAGRLAASTTATSVGPGTKVGEVAGPLRSVLTGERTRAQLPLPPLGGRDRSPAASCDAAGDRRGSGTPARRCPGCGRSRRRRCAPAGE